MQPTLLDYAKASVLKGDIDDGLQKLTEFLNGDFFNSEALFMLGNCFLAKGFNGVGAVISKAAIEAHIATHKKPLIDAMVNLGAAYKAENKHQIAEQIWLDILGLDGVPSRMQANILGNLCGLYVNQGAPEKAIEYADRGLALDPKNLGIKVNRGFAYLEQAKWREGWEGWANVYDNGDRHRRHYAGIPDWDGSPGKTVIVWGDQGVGDEIFFASCLKDMAQTCKKVILDCHPRLEHLFRRSFPDFEVHGDRKTMTELEWLNDCGADASTAFSDLPRFFRNHDDDWGDGAPYLIASDEYKRPGERWDGPLHVGLSWTGGVKKTRMDLRSMPLDALVPILTARPNVQFYSLQYTGTAAREVCELEERTGIRISHFPGWVETSSCFDYDRTASFAKSLDLIITVATTTHHLGGALGVPTWTLVSNKPNWKYQLTGETLPWYRSVRLFRQKPEEKWAPVIGRVAGALAAWR